MFVVPLADVAEPKKLVRALLVLTTLGLIVAAFSPGLGVLIAASLVIAATSIVARS